MTIDEAKAVVHSVYPGAFHAGHGTQNVIIERRYTDEERKILYSPISSFDTEQQKALRDALPTLKRLSQTFVNFPHWPKEIQDQLDTAMWVQAAAAVLAEKEGKVAFEYFDVRKR